ncbi:hypothetical protein L6452_14285 [Arctium lappa]|uniref:Uncharacterized protein n=1 Tax=Arctium lappa TaxID=4217 RepID=A0ACB9CKM7_ARCLA|nr:hypothetical protein L6452_14285 [Arctium lappa]
MMDYPNHAAIGSVLGALARKPYAFNGVKQKLPTRIINSSSRIDRITLPKDKDGNNMLHLVGETIRVKAAKTSGASLPMQRELLWFKKVEKMIPPDRRERKNNAGQLPHEIFSSNNQSLVVESLKWVKECMVVATLLITISFAVALTVPGGYHQSNGFPIFIQERIPFSLFVIANAISLFSSSTSLLVFFILYRDGLIWVPILIATFVIMPAHRICYFEISSLGGYDFLYT